MKQQFAGDNIVGNDGLSNAWSESKTTITAGSDDPLAASWYLTTSRIWPLMNDSHFGPVVLGVVLFAIIVATVMLSPSTESHFIYTDF